MALINRPTRVKQESATLIDNIFTNSFASSVKTFQCLIYTDITDHFPIVQVDCSSKYNNQWKIQFKEIYQKEINKHLERHLPH